MLANKLYTAPEVDFSYESAKRRTDPRKVFMVKPEYFEVIDLKNPYMQGKVIDKDLAWKQWQALYNVYKDLEERKVLETVTVLDGVEGCEDMVFCANQSLPWQIDGKNWVVMSHMRYPSRQKEVSSIEGFYTSIGYEIYHLKSEDLLEGNGDVILHPGRNLLWAGYGHRSGLGALKEIASALNVPVIPLLLISEYFYHLDTCFVPLGEDAVMLCSEAFDKDGLSAIKQVFSRVYEVSREEAVSTFSLNAHCLVYPDVRVAVLQKGSKEVLRILQTEGFEIYEVETSEFMKSGGSVFCMKMMYY